MRLLGIAMDELSNVVRPLEELPGIGGHQLAEQLDGLGDWGAPFELVERLLIRRLVSARDPSPAVTWAWQQLERSGGAVAIGDLARDLGCSRKHLVARFRREIGLPPKTVARILRFDRLVRRLDRDPAPRWADAALEAGYYDQPHLIREFRELAGVTPRQWLSARVTNAGIGNG
jgi:AraC-like DNA-binding protein